MANKSITQLQVASALTGLEAVPLVQNGVTKQATAQEIANLATGGGTSVTIANDIATNAALHPLFADTTSGTASTIYTSSPQYAFNPATGELSAPVVIATNGIFVNAANVSQDYTIQTGFNAVSAGPITVDSGVTVTAVDNTWTVVGTGGGGGGNLPTPYGVSGDVLVSTGAGTTPAWAPVDGGTF